MIVDWSKVEKMTPEEIENVRVEILKELQTLEDNHQIVKDEYMQKSRQIITLEGERKDLQISLSKSSHSIKNKKNDLQILETKFWQAKRG